MDVIALVSAGFDPPMCFNGLVAQMVERMVEAHGVGDSIAPRSTKYRRSLTGKALHLGCRLCQFDSDRLYKET